MLFKIHFTDPSLSLLTIFLFGISKEVSNLSEGNFGNTFKIVRQPATINHGLSWATTTVTMPVQDERTIRANMIGKVLFSEPQL